MECYDIVKLMLNISAGLLFLAGAALLGVSVYFVIEYASFMTLIASATVGDISLIVIIFAVVLLLLGGLGIWATCRDSGTLLLGFSVGLGIVILGEIGVAIAAFVLAGDIKAGAEGGMDKTMSGYPLKEDLKVVWDETQVQMRCCGSINYKNWAPHILSENGGNQTKEGVSSLPASCTSDAELLKTAKPCKVINPEYKKWEEETEYVYNTLHQEYVGNKNDGDYWGDKKKEEFENLKPPDEVVDAPDEAQCVTVQESYLPDVKNKSGTRSKREDAPIKPKIHPHGCMAFVLGYLLNAMAVIGGVLIAVGCLQIAAVVCSVCMYTAIRREEEAEIRNLKADKEKEKEEKAAQPKGIFK